MILFVNYLGKMRGYPQFSFWISITLVKIYIPCVIINRGKNTIELVGTVLKDVDHERCVAVIKTGCVIDGKIDMSQRKIMKTVIALEKKKLVFHHENIAYKKKKRLHLNEH